MVIDTFVDIAFGTGHVVEEVVGRTERSPVTGTPSALLTGAEDLRIETVPLIFSESQIRMLIAAPACHLIVTLDIECHGTYAGQIILKETIRVKTQLILVGKERFGPEGMFRLAIEIVGARCHGQSHDR